MSIKQSIASLVILLSVSFSAFSASSGIQYYMYGDDCGRPTPPSGTTSGLLQNFLSTYGCVSSIYLPLKNGSIGGGRMCGTYEANGSNRTVCEDYSSRTITCSSPNVYEPVTGSCQPPPPPPFCSRPETIDKMNQFKDACFDKGNGWSPEVSCSDETESLSMTCNPPPPESCEPGSPSFPACLDDENKCDQTHPDWNPEYGMCCSPENNWCDVPPPESCTIFSPNWPACSGDTDIDPPSGGDLGDPDKPDGGGSGGTDPDKPEPDVDNTSDTLAAIKAMNKDVNSQLTGINNDMNKNQAETKSALDALKASVDLNTDTVVDNANHVANAIQGQSDMLSDIGNKTNGLLTSANNLLNNGFGQLSNELGDLQSTNQQGFGDVIDALNELGNTDVTQGQGEAPVLLYDGTQYANLLSEVETLKGEYKQILNDFKSYFNFNDGVNSGDFNPHNLGLNWHGNAINQKNQVMLALQDNAGIISAVVLFIFGMLGIRALVGAL
ncbi:chemotaxis protein [Vibrio parahaemolyticus]|uniref:chemotaxis protein n=1 Tax=Vibrio parahaemolyticus TaxID=670 RepID=UPI00112120AC|nr:chemotaxis protein [Vibrio parahaemolyticus]EGR2702845.1 chemotaxis protein [Vibrio parahaemolyticus]MBE4197775.1 chemotaxis protein [Vibrio parahaemolyticus]MBE5125374.1 chemotaxis protein [Vibrio parahaemolyticus]TOA08958.1 chemotaxis protein [Vibrio parahaemolyticus]TOA62189.1 chemotaxis protein [Vibrio parahaemolyticus]